MSDRVFTMHELMERGFTYDEGLGRIALGDVIFDRAQALDEAAERVREFFCISLDGPQQWIDDPEFEVAFKDAVPKMDTAWREFREAVGEAERIVGRAA